jgi:hypothetical protein
MVAGLLKGEVRGRGVEALPRVGGGSWLECSAFPEDAGDASGGSTFEEAACNVRRQVGGLAAGAGLFEPRAQRRAEWPVADDDYVGHAGEEDSVGAGIDVLGEDDVPGLGVVATGGLHVGVAERKDPDLTSFGALSSLAHSGRIVAEGLAGERAHVAIGRAEMGVDRGSRVRLLEGEGVAIPSGRPARTLSRDHSAVRRRIPRRWGQLGRKSQ